MEEWKAVVGYEGFYEVSDQGRVRSVDHKVGSGIRHSTETLRKGRMLKQHIKRSGYCTVDLSANNVVKTISVHKLVATAFCPRSAEDTQINHINCNKTDNRACNLEWCTGLENRLHAKEHDRYYSSRKKTVRCKQANLTFESSYKAAEWINKEKFGNTKQVKNVAAKIRSACLGMQKIAYGYTWETV